MNLPIVLLLSQAVDAITVQGSYVSSVIGISLMLILCGCGSSDGARPGEVDRVDCRYNDASVPPQYHRSYSITATRSQIRVVVDSYGEILADQTFDMTEERMQELVEAIAALGIHTEKAVKDEKRCTGGTSRTIRVVSQGALLVDGTIYSCGGSVFGTLAGDVASFFRLLESMIPDFSKLLE